MLFCVVVRNILFQDGEYLGWRINDDANVDLIALVVFI